MQLLQENFKTIFLIKINRNLKVNPFCLSSQSSHLWKPGEREGNVSFSEILVFPFVFEFLKEYFFILFQICTPFPNSHLTFSSSLFLMTIFFLPHCFSFFSSSPSSAPLVSPSGSVLLIGLLPSAAALIFPSLTPSPSFFLLAFPLAPFLSHFPQGFQSETQLGPVFSSCLLLIEHFMNSLFWWWLCNFLAHC